MCREMEGTCLDDKLKELELTKLNLVIKAAKIGLWDMEIKRDDPINNENIINWSDEFRNLLGYTDENDFPNVINSFHECLHPDDFDRVTTAITAHMMDKTGKTPYDTEYRAKKKNGEYAYFRASGETIRDEEGNPILVAGTLMDITEAKTLLHNTEKLRLQAEEANKAKSAFLANMSHEIRTPLNAVLGLSDLILDTDMLDKENHFRLEQIYSAGETLLTTVNDILDISKIEAGRFELVSTKYDIPSMLNDAVTQSTLHRGDKSIDFKMNVSENLPTHLYGDELRVKQILTNLLANAFKYTMEGTVELTVGCIRDDAGVWLDFVIRDTGIGIMKENMANLFNDYVQMDIEANRKIVGTGLGLSISKRLTELMGGCITAESEYGKGSVFTARILQKHVTDEVVGPAVIESLRNFHYSTQKRHRNGSMSRISLPYARVLLVDDVVTNLDVAKGIMQPYDMLIDCVTGGWEAVEAIHDESVRYNAIFMDHMMPGIDGIEAARMIREIGTDYAKNIPIIALTANAIVGNEEMFLRNGFQAFISKPIEINRLDSIIREWVRDKEQEKLYSRAIVKTHSVPDDNGGKNYNTLHRGIYGVDIDKGIKRFGGNEGSYVAVLRSYAKNTPPLLGAIADITKENLAEYTTIIHGIKGSSRSISAYEVADMAEALEHAAHAGDYAYVSENNLKAVETVRRLISEINDMLAEIDADNIKPKKEKPDSGALDRLREACQRYEMNGVDEALEELEVYDYESGGELVSWLRENAEQMNFMEIIEKLSDPG